MSKNYQAPATDPTGHDVPGVPEQVRITLAEITTDLHEGLLALAVGTGLQVMANCAGLRRALRLHVRRAVS